MLRYLLLHCLQIIPDRIYVKVTFIILLGHLMRKVLKSVIVSLWYSTWVETYEILESDLSFLELYPCLELLIEVSLPLKL